MHVEHRAFGEPAHLFTHGAQERQTHGIVSNLFEPLPITRSTLHPMYRLVTDRKLRVIDDETGKSHAHVWAVGDASVFEDESLPATAQVTSQKALVRPPT